jgi:hypothetical protein
LLISGNLMGESAPRGHKFFEEYRGNPASSRDYPSKCCIFVKIFRLHRKKNFTPPKTGFHNSIEPAPPSC